LGWQVDLNEMADETRAAQDRLYSLYLDMQREFGDDSLPVDDVPGGNPLEALGDDGVERAAAVPSAATAAAGGGAPPAQTTSPQPLASRAKNPQAEMVMLLTDKRVWILDAKTNDKIWAMSICDEPDQASLGWMRSPRPAQAKAKAARRASNTGHAGASASQEPLLHVDVFKPTMTIIVEKTRSGFVVLCKSPEDALLARHVCRSVMAGKDDRHLIRAVYVPAPFMLCYMLCSAYLCSCVVITFAVQRATGSEQKSQHGTRTQERACCCKAAGSQQLAGSIAARAC
jgi:hypothetical protein